MSGAQARAREGFAEARGIALLETALFLVFIITMALGGWGLVVYQWEKNSLAEAIDRRVLNYRDRGFSNFRHPSGSGYCNAAFTTTSNSAPLADEIEADLRNRFPSYGGGDSGYWFEVGFACFRIDQFTGEPANDGQVRLRRDRAEIRGALAVPGEILQKTDLDSAIVRLASKTRSDGTSFWAHPRTMTGRTADSPGQYAIRSYVLVLRAVREVDAGPIAILKQLIDFDPFLVEQRIVVLR